MKPLMVCRIGFIHLYEIILKTCRLYLDLPASIDPAINASPETSEAFLIRILEDGDMGTDVSQALVGSGSYRKINLLTYFREGHVQMKVRFPKAGHCPLLWPALWPASFFCFLKNTYTLRDIRKILKIYGRDEIGGDCFRRLSGEKRVSELEQKFWQVLIRGYSLGMRFRFYFLLALGTRELIRYWVDERMSDTGLREA